METVLRFTLDQRDVTFVALTIPERNSIGSVTHKSHILLAVNTDRFLSIPAKKRDFLNQPDDDTDWHDILTEKYGAVRHDNPITGAAAFLRTQLVYNKKFKPLWIPETRAHFQNNQMHGLFKTWYANGKKHEEAHYTHDRLCDVLPDIPAYRKWLKTGSLCRLEHFQDGQPVNVTMHDGLPPFANKYFDKAGHLVQAYDADTGAHYHDRSLEKFLTTFQHNGGDIVDCRNRAKPPVHRLFTRLAASFAVLFPF
jgi:hypothetical protein